MDIIDILSFKPDKQPKRNADTDNGDVGQPRKQRRLLGVDSDDLKQDVEAMEDLAEGDDMDETAVKKMLLNFEKKLLKNQEMRIKFPDQPERFLESEMDLNEAIQTLHAIATVPEFYHILVDLHSVSSLLGLLAHDNTDISIAVVDLLQELTDVDTLNESEDSATALVDALLEDQACALLVQNLERLDESVSEEADGVHNTLGIIENLTEFKPEMCVEAAQQGLFQWLLKRQKSKIPFDANKLYCSEILSVLLQGHEDNRRLLGELDGIDVLLQQLAFYKRHNPGSVEELEMMENLFNSLCSCLMFEPNRDRFLRGEGLQLMNLMLREKKLSRNGALKVLDHALSGPEGTDNCNKFVDILGLRTIFPLFMKTPKKQKRKGVTAEEHEEHVTSIIAAMLKNCRGTQRQRLLNKFIENDLEKVDRMMELHFKYLDRVHNIDIEVERERQMYDAEEDDDRVYLRRLEGGLFALQIIDFIMLEVCASGPPVVKQRVMQILNLRNASIKTIRNVMREYAGNLGDAEESQDKEQEQQKILQLVDKF